MRRSSPLRYSLIAFTILLASCSSERSPQPAAVASPSPSGSAGTELNVWVIANSSVAQDNFMDVIRPYLDQHPNVTVRAKVLNWSTAWADITSAVMNKTGPDIYQLGTTWVPAIAAVGGLADLSRQVPELGGENEYLPASWASVKIGDRPAVYAVPWFAEARALFYRKDAFRAAGVNADEAFRTWESFREALRRVQGVEAGGRKLSAFGTPGNDRNVAHDLFPWIWAAGSDVLSTDGTKAVFNDDKGMRALQYFASLVRDGLVDPSSLEKTATQIESDFADGKTAVIISGNWFLKDLATPRDQGGFGGIVDPAEVGVAPLPEGPAGRATFIGGSDLAISATSEHREEAWDLLSYLSGDEAQLAYAERSGMLPARMKLLESSLYAEDPNDAAFAEAVRYGRAYPSIPQWGAVENALVEYLGEIWNGVASHPGSYGEEEISRRLDQAAREIDLILAS